MDTILHAGVANAVLATALALTAWAVGRAVRRPALTHALWLLVLLKLVTPPFWTIHVTWPAATHSMMSKVAGAGVFESTGPASESGGGAAGAAEDFNPGNLPDDTISTAAAPTAIDAPSLAAPDVRQRPARRASAPFWLWWSAHWKHAVAGIWLAGAVLFWSIAALRVGWLRQLLRDAQPASEELRQQIRTLAQRLGVRQPPEVWLMPVPIPPMLWAVLGKPRLLLPAALWEALAEEQRETLLVHELLHLRGRDHWVRRLELLTLGLYWWHPVAWWARRELREAEEQRCDAWVVGALPASAAAYAQTLLDTVAFLSRARCATPVGASSMGQVRVLKRRLTMILQGTTANSGSRRYAWVALGIGALLLPLMPTFAQPQREAGADKSAAKRPAGGDEKGAGPKREAVDKLILSGRLALDERPRGRGREQTPDEMEARLAELEKQLEALRKEISMLRREKAARGGKEPRRRGHFINLQPWANQKLDDDFHSGQYAGNNLASLPRGQQTFDGVQFNIGKSLLQLGPSVDKPEKIEGIKVGRGAGRLQILHATGYIRDDEAQIAEYVIHYEDRTTETIPVVYGKDVLDWWKYPFSGEPTRGKVVWNGENEPAKKEFDATIRLYLTTWENPKPNVRITSIDYAMSNNEDRCAPFCVAITAEDK